MQVLDAAQNSKQNRNNAFFANLTEISENITAIQYQIDKYLKANALRQKSMASNVRLKLKALQLSIAFQIRLIDSVYVTPPVNQQQIAKNQQPLAPSKSSDDIFKLQEQVRI